MELSTINVGPAQRLVYYYRAGQGKPLLYLHHLLGLRGFEPALQNLASHYDVIAPYAPGWGPAKDDLTDIDPGALDLTLHHVDLLDALGLSKVKVVGISIGAWMAAELAAIQPSRVEQLVLVNPLGLKDRSEEGLPYVDVDTLWANEKKTSYASIKAYQLENYYHGQWKPAYDRWVWMQAGMYAGNGRDQVALAQAKTSEMIKTQPVAHELYRITPPTTLIVGTLDKTAFGRAQVPPNLRQFLQAIPVIAPVAARQMKNATLVRMEGLGHSPQVEDPARFERTLLAALGPARG